MSKQPRYCEQCGRRMANAQAKGETKCYACQTPVIRKYQTDCGGGSWSDRADYMRGWRDRTRARRMAE